MMVFAGSIAVVASIGLLLFALIPSKAERPSITLPRRTQDTLSDFRQSQLRDSAADRLVSPVIRGFLSAVSRVTPVGFLDASARRLVAAGLSAEIPLELLVGVKVALACVTTLLAIFLTSFDTWYFNVAAIGGAAAAGFAFPDFWVTKKAEKRNDEIRSALPGTLDQLTVIVEAGLGFDSALKRVVLTSSGPLADEFARVLLSVRLGQSRSEALAALADRIDVPEVRGFVSAIRQADKLGVPIAKILRTQSQHMRELAGLAAEEQAMKLPVKLTFPMVFCMLPALFVVLLGPIVIRVLGAGF